MKLMLKTDSGSGKKRGWEGGTNKGNLEGEIDEYLEEKTSVEIIKEREQKTSHE